MPIWSIWRIAFVTMPAPTRPFWTFGYGRNKTAKMITSLTFVTTYKIVIWAWQIALVTLGPRILFWFWFWFWRWPMRIPADIWKKMSMRKQYWKFSVLKIRTKHRSVLLLHYYPSITDGVHRNENFVEIIPVFSTFSNFFKKKNYKSHFM